MPPLRDRRCEIPLLAARYLQRIARRDNTSIAHLTADAQMVLENYHWPGNVRELHNVLEQSIIQADDGDIERRHLPTNITNAAPAAQSPHASAPALTGAVDEDLSPLARARRQGEVALIREALHRAGDNRTRAATELGISRAALYKKLREFGLLTTRPVLE